MLEGELKAHLGYSESVLTIEDKSNARNGFGRKKLKTQQGKRELKAAPFLIDN